MKQTLMVKGMHCRSCSMLVQEALEEAGAQNVSVKLDEKKQIGTVTLDTSLAKAKLAAIIKEQGDYTIQ
jgi:copper chaperone CopZ